MDVDQSQKPIPMVGIFIDLEMLSKGIVRILDLMMDRYGKLVWETREELRSNVVTE